MGWWKRVERRWLRRLCEPRIDGEFERECLDLELDAGDLSGAVGEMAARTLAQLSETDVAGLAELNARGDDHGVDVDAELALEFKEHGDGAGVAGSAAEHPAAASKDGAGKRLHEVGGLNGRNGLHLHRPGIGDGDPFDLLVCDKHFSRFIGGGRDAARIVPESHGK